MGDVVSLPSREGPEEMVWRCGECGCLTFYIYADNTKECAHCNYRGEMPEGTWTEPPAAGERPSPCPPDPKIVTDIKASGAALRKTVEHATADIDGTAAIIVLKDNGDVHTWGKTIGGEQVGWFDRRIAVARECFVGRGGDGAE